MRDIIQVAHGAQPLQHRTARDEAARGVIDHEGLVHVVRRLLKEVGRAVERAVRGVVHGARDDLLRHLEVGGELINAVDGADVHAARVAVDHQVVEEGSGRGGVGEGAHHILGGACHVLEGARGPEGQQGAPHGAGACGLPLSSAETPTPPSGTRHSAQHRSLAASLSHRAQRAVLQHSAMGSGGRAGTPGDPSSSVISTNLF